MKRFVCLGACLWLGACGGDGGSSGDPAAVAEAKTVWKDKCVTCHGDRGRGDGPGAMALDPKPRSFADPRWQMQTKDERIAKVIVEGGAAVGLHFAGLFEQTNYAVAADIVAAALRGLRTALPGAALPEATEATPAAAFAGKKLKQIELKQYWLVVVLSQS